MNEPQNSFLPSRRSFIKKSIVAGVAVSNMTIFSGLVNAADTGQGACYQKPRETQWWCEVVVDEETLRIYKCKDVGTITVIGYCTSDKKMAYGSIPNKCKENEDGNVVCTMNPDYD